jgi:hypothetical protein
MLPSVIEYFKITTEEQTQKFWQEIGVMNANVWSITFLSLLYGLLWNQGFFMSRVISCDLIANTCTIEMFMVSILTCLIGARSNQLTLTKLLLACVSIAGFALFIQEDYKSGLTN